MNDHAASTVGIDISKAHLDVHRLSTEESGNAARGFEELAAWLGDSADRPRAASEGRLEDPSPEPPAEGLRLGGGTATAYPKTVPVRRWLNAETHRLPTWILTSCWNQPIRSGSSFIGQGRSLTTARCTSTIAPRVGRGTDRGCVAQLVRAQHS